MIVEKKRRGRPKIDPGLKKVSVAYKLRPWIVEWLRAQDRPATQLIEEAVAKTYGVKPPSSKY